MFKDASLGGDLIIRLARRARPNLRNLGNLRKGSCQPDVRGGKLGCPAMFGIFVEIALAEACSNINGESR